MHQLFAEQGLECRNYDLKDGAHCDRTDDAVWDPILRDSAAGEYRACFASPECGTFSQLHNKLLADRHRCRTPLAQVDVARRACHLQTTQEYDYIRSLLSGLHRCWIYSPPEDCPGFPKHLRRRRTSVSTQLGRVHRIIVAAWG